MYLPVARSACAHSMNWAKASALGGGAHMKRRTSGELSSAYSAPASGGRSSRRVRRSPASSGSPSRHSFAVVSLFPRKGVPPDDGVPPHHGIAPDHGVPPDDGVAPDDGVPPHHRIAPDDGVAPHDGLTPRPALAGDDRRCTW